MNSNLSPKEAKEILTLLKQGNNLNLGLGNMGGAPAFSYGASPSQPQAPVVPKAMNRAQATTTAIGNKPRNTGATPSGSLDQLGKSFNTIGNGIAGGVKAVGSAINSGLDAAGNAMHDTYHGVGNMAHGAANSLGNMGHSAVDTLGISGSRLGNAAHNYVSGVTDMYNKGISSVGRAIEGGARTALPIAGGVAGLAAGGPAVGIAGALAGNRMAQPFSHGAEGGAPASNGPLVTHNSPPKAPQPVGPAGQGFNLNTPLPTLENPAMQMRSPILQDRGIAVGKQQAAPAPAPVAQAQQFSGAITPEERQLMRRLHGGSDYYEKTDRAKLDQLRAAGKELGGYGDFKNLRNLAYANQYGANSDYGRLAAKFRDNRAQELAQAQGMPIKSSADYTVLTRRNTGITTTNGNIWINPADNEWLDKSAAYQDVSWEDYCNLDPDDEPKSIATFFSDK